MLISTKIHSQFIESTKKNLKNFSNKAFFSDFVQLEQAIIISCNCNCPEILNEVQDLIEERKKELLSFWAIDLLHGFRNLNATKTNNDIKEVNYKFTNNENKHAIDVMHNASPEAKRSFFEAMKEALKSDAFLQDMPEIKKQLKELNEEYSQDGKNTAEYPEKLQALFEQAVNERLKQLQVKDKTIQTDPQQSQQKTESTQTEQQPQQPSSPEPKPQHVTPRPKRSNDPYHKLKELTYKNSNFIKNEIDQEYLQLNVYGNVHKDDLEFLRERAKQRINKYGSESFNPQTEAEEAAKRIYTGAEVKDIQINNKPAFEMTRENGQEKAFHVEKVEPTANNKGGISLTFDLHQPTSESLVAGAEIVKDAVALIQSRNETPKVIIDQYEKNPADALAIYCSLASQEHCIEFDEEINILNSRNNENKDYAAYYDIAKVLKELRAEGTSGNEKLILMTKDNNKILNELIEIAKGLTKQKNNENNINTDLKNKLNSLLEKEGFSSSRSSLNSDSRDSDQGISPDESPRDSDKSDDESSHTSSKRDRNKF